MRGSSRRIKNALPNQGPRDIVAIPRCIPASDITRKPFRGNTHDSRYARGCRPNPTPLCSKARRRVRATPAPDHCHRKNIRRRQAFPRSRNPCPSWIARMPRRAWACELSTMDTGFLILGMLVAAEYFSGDNARERELRERVDELYYRVEWDWACNRAHTLSHGYSPEKGFLKYRWRGYNEGLPLYLLALGSAAHSLSGESYRAWTRSYQWKCVYGYEYLYAGPLFIHQFMHAWIDFRGLQDDFMREKSIDYFENSRRATYVQREYCRRNSQGFECRSELSWGITACDGPGPCVRRIKHRKMRFFGYHARGVPFGPDDGTVSA